VTPARRPGFALRRILRITAEGAPSAFDLSTESTRVLTDPIPTFLKASFLGRNRGLDRRDDCVSRTRIRKLYDQFAAAGGLLL
jgi:hypothetical protein